jgi:DNA-binding CsgD family transcriptional regulator
VTDPTELAQQLRALGGDIHRSLEEVQVPMYVLDRDRTIKWLNEDGKRLLPRATGRLFDDLLAPEVAESARRRYARRMRGEAPFVDHAMVLKTSTGERHAVEISSAPLVEGHRIVGVFGVVRSDRRLGPRSGAKPSLALTPRQHEVLQLLGAGLTTRQMSEQMGLSVETVRNHVRAVLAQLGARSRLEAVLLAHRLGVLEPPAAD